MAFPHPPGLLPAEVAFLCEMEMVTVVPRQRLERLDLLGGPTNPLVPPQRTNIPLWLALLLKRQRRINILPPPWLEPENLREILEMETQHFQDSFSPAPPLPALSSATDRLRRNEALVAAREVDVDGRSQYVSPPFTLDATAQAQPHALPYHWHALSELILNDASDDVLEPDTVRNLLRDIREVRLAKMRKGVDVLTGDGEGVRLDGVGSMELAESRGFVVGVMDGLRRLGASKEAERRDGEARDAARADDDEDDDMLE